MLNGVDHRVENMGNRIWSIKHKNEEWENVRRKMREVEYEKIWEVRFELNKILSILFIKD